jgi:hypothetical protein
VACRGSKYSRNKWRKRREIERIRSEGLITIRAYWHQVHWARAVDPLLPEHKSAAMDAL